MKQSFSHGRSNTVVVEIKKRASSRRPASPPAEAPEPAAKRRPAPKPAAARPAARKPSAQDDKQPRARSCRRRLLREAEDARLSPCSSRPAAARTGPRSSRPRTSAAARRRIAAPRKRAQAEGPRPKKLAAEQPPRRSRRSARPRQRAAEPEEEPKARIFARPRPWPRAPSAPSRPARAAAATTIASAASSPSPWRRHRRGDDRARGSLAAPPPRRRSATIRRPARPSDRSAPSPSRGDHLSRARQPHGRARRATWSRPCSRRAWSPSTRRLRGHCRARIGAEFGDRIQRVSEADVHPHLLVDVRRARDFSAWPRGQRRGHVDQQDLAADAIRGASGDAARRRHDPGDRIQSGYPATSPRSLFLDTPGYDVLPRCARAAPTSPDRCFGWSWPMIGLNRKRSRP